MPPKNDPKPFGVGPATALKDKIDAVEFAAMQWTNNVAEHAPTEPEEARDMWDEAVGEAHRIADASDELLRIVEHARRRAYELTEAALDASEEGGA